MENDWRPIAELRPGHYAVGLCADGHEIDIYRDGKKLVNVATGEKLLSVTGWRSASVKIQTFLR